MKQLFLRSWGNKQPVIICIISLVLFVSVFSVVYYLNNKKSVMLEMNGETIEVSTHAKTVEQLLQDQNIDVATHDKISPSLSTPIVNDMAISWKQAKKVTISIDGNQSKVWTTETKVKDILKEANIEVSEHDSLAQELDTELGAENEISIQKAFQVTLVDDENKRQIWSTSTTVANF